MWHEARKQEKKIRGLMVDFKKRAERRREFYERIKLDPTQFLRLQGRPLRIHIDHAVAMAAESPQSMMPWRGHTDNMIDRFDVRANLDIIPENVRRSPVIPTKAEAQEERICSYESYRTLVENEAAGLSEEQCLYQIYVDEQFGPVTKVGSTEDEKKKLSEKKAAIGFSYDESAPPGEKEKEGEGSEDEESSDTDVETADLDVTLDVDLLTLEQMDLLNQCAHQFGMKEDDYISLLTKDKEEMESLRQAKMLEEEKAQFSGRKSRRERRAFKEKKMAGRKISPPSYAARESPKQTTYEKKSSSSSRSRSRSPERPTKVLFITSFGGESEEEAGPVQGPQLPAPANDNTSKSESRHNRRNSGDKSRRGENSRSFRKGNSRSRSPRRATSRSRSPRRATSRSRSPRRATSRSRSPGRRRRGHSRSASGSPRGRHYSDRRRSRSRSPLRHNRSPAKGYRRNYGYSSGRGRSRSRSRSRSKDKGKQPQASKQPASQTSRTKSRSKSSSRSRSSSYSSSRSRSSRSRSKSRAHSKSHSPNGNSKPVIKRYRRPSLSSGSGDESDGSDSKDSDVKPKGFVPAPGSGNTVAALQLTKSAPKPMDRLKRRMQAALNRQYKADKKAEQVRTVKMEQERMEREEEMRSRMLEIRRKERERRHLERERDKKSGQRRHSGSDSDSSSDDSGPARHRSRSPSPKHRRQRSRSRSRSRGRSERASRDEGRSERRSRDEGRGDRAWGGDGGRSERTSRDDQDRERRPRSSNY